MIWFEGGGVALAFLMSAPPAGGGDRLRFDIFQRMWRVFKAPSQ
jgi:hypothetical protein